MLRYVVETRLLRGMPNVLSGRFNRGGHGEGGGRDLRDPSKPETNADVAISATC